MYSVIVPIYNSEAHLRRCLDSIINQTNREFELILVNDGSKDKSGEICKEYAEKDNRVVYIETENKGVSSARNTGINNAKGDYIGFVDSDDEVFADMYDVLLKNAREHNAQIVICDALTVYENGIKDIDTLPVFSCNSTVLRGDITVDQISYMAGAAWRCIYKRELLKDENVRFPLGIKLSEDRIFNILAMGKAEKIYYIKKPFYLRYVINGSAVNKYYNNYLDIVVNAHKKTTEALEYCGFSKEFFDAYKMHVAYGALSAVYNEFHPNCKNKLNQKIKNVKAVCFDDYVQNNFPSSVGDKKLKLIQRKKVYTLVFLCQLRKIIKK